MMEYKMIVVEKQEPLTIMICPLSSRQVKYLK